VLKDSLFLTLLSSLLLMIALICPTQAVEPDHNASSTIGEETRPQAAAPSFGPVTRLHLRVDNKGEQSVMFGSFMFLPLDFNFAGLIELDGKAGEWHGAGEAKLARAFYPQSAWGRAAGLVARLQVGDLYSPTWGIGLQWNITDTPGIIETTKNLRWKSLVQIFVKSKAEYADNESGLIDFYHWYQFPLGDRLYLRGVNAYYQMRNSRNYYNLMQDVIYPASKDVEIFLHHEYRSTDFMGKSKGSRIGLGIRFAI